MKTDLATSIIAVVAGVIIAYFVTNIFTPSIDSVTFQVLDESVEASLKDPDNEIFNYRSVNPTVEVYVGKCTGYDENGKCIDDVYATEGEDGNTN